MKTTLRIKYESRSRLIPNKITSITEFRDKIASLYGEECKNFAISFKDVDGEYVSIIDDEDLDNCYREAEELKVQCVTFFIKSNVGKDVLLNQHEEMSMATDRSDDFIDVETLIASRVEIQDNDAEAKGQSQILLPLAEDKHKIDALQVTNKKAKEQSKSKSKDKKNSEPQKKANQEAAKVATNPVEKPVQVDGTLLPKEATKKPIPPITPFQEAVLELKYLKRLADLSKQEHPLLTLNAQLTPLLATSCPGLKFNPSLANNVIAASRDELAEVIKRNYEKLATQESFKKEVEIGKENEKLWREYRQRCEEIGENEANKELALKDKAAAMAKAQAEKEELKAKVAAAKKAKEEKAAADQAAKEQKVLLEKQAKEAKAEKEKADKEAKQKALDAAKKDAKQDKAPKKDVEKSPATKEQPSVENQSKQQSNPAPTQTKVDTKTPPPAQPPAQKESGQKPEAKSVAPSPIKEVPKQSSPKTEQAPTTPVEEAVKQPVLPAEVKVVQPKPIITEEKKTAEPPKPKPVASPKPKPGPMADPKPAEAIKPAEAPKAAVAPKSTAVKTEAPKPAAPKPAEVQKPATPKQAPESKDKIAEPQLQANLS